MLVFISHIHEEKELALLIKEAISSEFSGFVDVFVSSDGISIPSGSNFLSRIEEALISCSAAIYLISPKSVRRNWINFELGSVWIRSCIKTKEGGSVIPAIPFCHSGMTPSLLPKPLGDLNAISAGDRNHLEVAFRSLQQALGGKGALKTDFKALSSKVRELESSYTIGQCLKEALGVNGLLPKEAVEKLIEHCGKAPAGTPIPIKYGFIPRENIDLMKKHESGSLQGKISIQVMSAGMGIGPNGAISGGDISLTVNSSLIIEHKALLLGDSP